MTYQPLHHKYRPQTFAQLVGQEAIATTLTNALAQQRIAPAYLFTGARGTGKTSSARIFAKSLNCVSGKVPTANPCGICETCRAIGNGSALDVMEIDAASNTGVDNIRELIERAQFAPVQCRYKVYVIDECLTGDTLVETREGLVRIDDANLKDKQVLSYSDASGKWEYRKVLRWLDQGERQTWLIKTTHREIRCTDNHLIRTDKGWITAKDVKEGVRILSPVNVAVAPPSINMGRMVESADLSEVINLRETLTVEKNTTWAQFLTKLRSFVHFVHADAAINLTYPFFFRRREQESSAFNPIGKIIPTEKGMEIGTTEPPNLLQTPKSWTQKPLGLFTGLSWAMVPSLIQTLTADFLDYVGHTESSSKIGWRTKPLAFQPCVLLSVSSLTLDTVMSPFAAEPFVTPVSNPSLTLSNLPAIARPFQRNGSARLLLKDWLGGTWTTALSPLHPTDALKFNSTQKDILLKKINSSLTGLQDWATPPKSDRTQEQVETKPTSTPRWEQMPLENGCQTSNLSQSPQWSTSLETIVSVHLAGVERVYDIEVEDNHNFVANGLLVHNCHMLSPAAFNALLKTLEEPPDRVVFVLATTDPQRVLPTIISRCQRFDFRRIPLNPLVQHLKMIAEKEGITIAQDALQLIGQISQGGLRDAESLLDQLSLLDGEVTVDRVWDLVGAVPERDLMGLVEAIAAHNPEAVLDHTRRLMDRGREPIIVLQNLASFYRDLLIAKTSPSRHDLVAITPPTWTRLCEFAKTLDLNTILMGQQHLRSSETQLKQTTQPRLWLEVTLMGLLPGMSPPSQPAVYQTPTQPVSSVSEPRSQPAPISSSYSQGVAPQTPPPEIVPPEVAPVTESTEANQPDDPQSELAKTWQQILENIDLPSTQGIVSANCHLVAIEGNEIVVGVRGEHMLKMTQRMLPQIGKAATRALQTKIKVSIQVLDAVAPLPIESPPESPTPQPVSDATAISSSDPQGVAPAESEPPEVLEEPVDASADAPPPRKEWKEDDDVTKAAKSLAYAFNGAVINLDDDESADEILNSDQVVEDVEPDAIEPEELEEPDDEEDVDF
ncbi:DNA polymerase III subunit gamma/tau [Phormidesmis priestleyi]